MITTDFAPGSPCMLDLGTPTSGRRRLLRRGLGWDYEPMGDGEDVEGGMFGKNGKMVAGLGKLTEEGARPAWMIYYTVTDADATTEAVEARRRHRAGPPDGPRAVGADGAVQRPRWAASSPSGSRGRARASTWWTSGLAVLDRAVHERRGRREGVLRRSPRLALQRHADAGGEGTYTMIVPSVCRRNGCTAA
ncbi:hypothetical protein GCM10023238_22860 [Streptomyces heliomycini]